VIPIQKTNYSNSKIVLTSDRIKILGYDPSTKKVIILSEDGISNNNENNLTNYIKNLSIGNRSEVNLSDTQQ
jgi:succinyl-CoA synthetase alpha subunit